MFSTEVNITVIHVEDATSHIALETNFWLRLSWFSSVPPGKFEDGTANQVMIASFQITSCSLCTDHTTVWLCTVDLLFTYLKPEVHVHAMDQFTFQIQLHRKYRLSVTKTSRLLIFRKTTLLLNGEYNRCFIWGCTKFVNKLCGHKWEF